MSDSVDWIGCISPGVMSAIDLAKQSGMDKDASLKILNGLAESQIGEQQKDGFIFSDGDRLKAAIHALESGASIDEVAEQISWKDFEGLAAEILESNGFDVTRNLILKKPRREIDVIGIKQDTAILVDCKHWKRSSTSALHSMTKKQTERAKLYVTSYDIQEAIPVIVTLYQDAVGLVDRVPVVPIFKFQSFLDEMYGNLDYMIRVRAS